MRPRKITRSCSINLRRRQGVSGRGIRIPRRMHIPRYHRARIQQVESSTDRARCIPSSKTRRCSKGAAACARRLPAAPLRPPVPSKAEKRTAAAPRSMLGGFAALGFICGDLFDILHRTLFDPPVHFTRASAISRYDILSRIRRNLAVGVGFEPTEPLGSPVFKTGAFGHSATPPRIISASERCKPPDAFCARSAKTVKSEITRLE